MRRGIQKEKKLRRMGTAIIEKNVSDKIFKLILKDKTNEKFLKKSLKSKSASLIKVNHFYLNMH